LQAAAWLVGVCVALWLGVSPRLTRHSAGVGLRVVFVTTGVAFVVPALGLVLRLIEDLSALDHDINAGIDLALCIPALLAISLSGAAWWSYSRPSTIADELDSPREST
jgi:hypothetical protein